MILQQQDVMLIVIGMGSAGRSRSTTQSCSVQYCTKMSTMHLIGMKLSSHLVDL
jgi:hypothetical protein